MAGTLNLASLFSKFPPLPFLTRKMLKFEEGASFTLIVRVLMTDTAPILIHGYTREGAFTYQIFPAFADTEQEIILGIPDIPIAISVGYADLQIEQTTGWVMVYLGIYTNRASLLMQGQITSLHNISWPVPQQANPLQANGQIAKIFPTETTGDEWIITVPLAQVWEILGAAFLLTTNATAIDRTPGIVFQLAETRQIVRLSGTTQQANEVITYSFVTGGTDQVITANQHTEIAIPDRIFTVDGDTIASLTTNLQGGDSFSIPAILVRRWYQHS